MPRGITAKPNTAKLQVVIHEDEHKLTKLLASVYGITLAELGSSLIRDWVIEQMQRDDTREALEIEGALEYADAMVTRIEKAMAEEAAMVAAEEDGVLADAV